METGHIGWPRGSAFYRYNAHGMNAAAAPKELSSKTG
jgi:hypothetical protein